MFIFSMLMRVTQRVKKQENHLEILGGAVSDGAIALSSPALVPPLLATKGLLIAAHVDNSGAGHFTSHSQFGVQTEVKYLFFC